MESPTTATRASRKPARPSSQAASQSSAPASSIARGVVPWPGNRRPRTRKPPAARASPRGRTSQGVPVKPCNSRQAPGPTPNSKGAVSCRSKGGASDGAPLAPAPAGAVCTEAMSDPKVPETALQIQIDETVAQGLYANMALVNHTDAEFTLDFIYVQPQQPKAAVRARIITSPRHMKRLLTAMADNLQKYEARFGVIEALSPDLPVH